ncbi:hypothetical protein NKR19_g1212 [Coniochaeta hoffmannii]|uniref:Uncharacterized protein n=1 Tax=Coniochaeta hoffmannii TaxID=91930 RepID=A0AA38S095_9PEZI|nr:hypothetical protein NKR19_g1212 [Coniochaeta hoffmannii]
MCFAEEIQYCCGHHSPPVVRPCPITTAGHNNPICQIQYTNEYVAETMCVACERVLHSRWTLLQEWEHCWYHERGVCRCEVKFPDLDIRPHVIGAGVNDTTRSDDEITLVGCPKMPPVNTQETDKTDTPDSKNEPNSSDNSTQAIPQSFAHKERAKDPMVVGGTRTSARSPALYEETSESEKTHVAVRKPSQYAAEWLEDHRALHASGQCKCNVDTKPISKSNTEGTLTADEEKLLVLHHQITGDGHSPEEWSPPTKEQIDNWRKETDVPELGTKPKYTVNRRRAPDTTTYPVPLGNNMYLTESLVVWDAELLASRVKSMQIASNVDGSGVGPSIMVPNGRGNVQNGFGAPVTLVQESSQYHPYHHNAAVQQQHSAPHGAPQGPTEQHGGYIAVQGAGYRQQMQAQPGMVPNHSGSQQKEESVPRNNASNMSVTPPQEDVQTQSVVFHPLSGAGGILGWFELTPPNTHAGKGMNGSLPIHSTATAQGIPSKSTMATPKPTGLPAAVVNGTRPVPNGSAPSSANKPSSGPTNAGSGTTSAAATPSGKHKRKKTKTPARKLKLKQRKEEARQEQLAAGKDDNDKQRDDDKQRRDVTPLCGLPIGAGPESSIPHMPPFADCSLFYPPVSKHRRGSSCPQFPDSQSLLPSSRD